jgi:hypothetical protein
MPYQANWVVDKFMFVFSRIQEAQVLYLHIFFRPLLLRRFDSAHDLCSEQFI